MGKSVKNIKRIVGRVKLARKMRNFINASKLNEDDIILASYPKSGNTWIKMLLVHLKTQKNIDFDNVDDYAPGLNEAFYSQERVIVKTHENARFIPKLKNKIIYIYRHPESVIKSYYKHNFREGMGVSDPNKFAEECLNGSRDGYGSWDSHVESYVELNAGNVLFINYENFLENPFDNMRRISLFLGWDIENEKINLALDMYKKESCEKLERKSKNFKNYDDTKYKFVGDTSFVELSGDIIKKIDDKWRSVGLKVNEVGN